MKKWLFVISPALMLAVFIVFYLSDRAQSEIREKAHQAELDRQKADAAEKKAAAEAKAKADAQKRDEERAAEVARVAKEKQDKYDADMARIKAATDKSNATAQKFADQVSELTIKLDNLHKQKDELTRHNFDLIKQVQLAEVARHTAEMDIQRMVEMISDRADQSAMSKMPPPPPPPAKES
jgi:ABC-type Na+ efflux pump permease subunit